MIDTVLKKFHPLFSAILFFGLLSAPLCAQTAAELEELLQTRAVTYAQAARFVLEAADAASLKDQNLAFAFAAEQRWLPQKSVPCEPAKLDGVSLLLMRSFDVKGGVWYSLTKHHRYAYRELVYQDIIQGRADPKMTLSGEQLLFLINRLLSVQEGIASAAAERAERAEREQLAAEQDEAHARQLALAEEINNRFQALGITDASARVTDEGVTISLSNIQSSGNSADLPETEKKKLQEIAQILKTISSRKIVVAGHTAQAGTEQSRVQASRERAQAAADYLVSMDARKAEEIEVYGYGSQQSIADNRTPEGMALNRRVEFTIVEDTP
ncbi:MAG: OmpA family protein [Treponema sp.]|nr:OmpA family protein [Treponema sp.]